MREHRHPNLCDLELRIDGDHTFLLDKELLCSFSAKLRRMVKTNHHPRSSLPLQLDDFPGGPEAFEVAARFCYNRGNRIHINPSNIALLHCVATTLEMTGEEPITPSCNLLPQTEAFLDTLFQWSWNDLLASLRAFSFSSSSKLLLFHSANTSGLLHRLSSSLLAKIFAATSDTPFHSPPSSSSSPEPTNGFRSSLSSHPRTPEPSGRTTPSKEWWFDDLTTLHPKIIEKITTLVEPHENGRNLLLLTRFLLHYLARGNYRGGECSALADVTVHGVLSLGKRPFSCRGLFRVLRVASSAGVSSGCREKLESLMGSLLDQATLDDLLVSAGHHNQTAVYDVDLVLRLVKVFAGDDGSSPERAKKVGKLLDLYLGEVSPDQGLEPSKFQSLAESLPDHARDCFDGVYVALDIYLQSHPGLTIEERARLCSRCLNYDKLSMGARRDLAKNPRVPPRAAVRALLVPQQKQRRSWCGGVEEAPRAGVYWKEGGGDEEEMRMKLEKMQRKVIQLERSCREIQGKMSRMEVTNADARNHHHHHNRYEQQHEQQRPMVRGLPRLC